MKAFVIYDTLSSFGKANAALQRFAPSADFAVTWSIKPWRVAMLKFPPAAEEALTEAMDADLIVLAGEGVQLFHFWLQDWLENWAECRQVKDAALAIIGAGNTRAPSPMAKSDLSEYARKHGLSVIFDDRDSIPIPVKALNPQVFNERYRKYGVSE